MIGKAQDNPLIDSLIQANQLRYQKEYLQAIEVYVEAIRKYKETSELARTIAHCHFNLGFYENQESEKNFQLATDWMKKAINLMPNSSQLFAELAEFFALGTLDYPSAISEYKTAIALNPNNIRALVGAASLYGLPEEVVSLEEAIDWLTSASRLDPNNPNLHLRLGMLLLESNQVDNAKKEFEAALLCPLALDTNLAETIKKVEE